MGLEMKILFHLLTLGFSVLALQQCKTVELDQPDPKTGSPKDTTTYTCAGKTFCSEMISCGEARYYLDHCPDTQMDGDADGIPCEEQHCGH
jgi:hypothetical protein